MGTLQEDSSTDGQGRIPGRPLGLQGVGELHQVRHGSGDLIVEVLRALVGCRVPAVVSTGDEQVNLVVVVWTVLHRPHLAGAGAQGQALRVSDDHRCRSAMGRTDCPVRQRLSESRRAAPSRPERTGPVQLYPNTRRRLRSRDNPAGRSAAGLRRATALGISGSRECLPPVDRRLEWP